MSDLGKMARKGASASSARWLQRQRRDSWRREAAREGYRSRAAYKLLEIDRRFGFLRRGARVVDLGAAPGGWSQAAARRIGAAAGREWLVGVDVLEIAPVAGCRFLQRAFPAPELQGEIRSLLQRVDVVLSDMLANVSGRRLVDHERSLALCQAAEAFAAEMLSPGGTLCCKLLRGGDGTEEQLMLADWQTRFRQVARFKPKASRGESAEIYLVATGFAQAVPIRA